MSRRHAFLFPGQGTQYPGMGLDFYREFVEAKEIFDSADDLLQTPFSRLIFEGPSAELTLTKNSQLAIFIVSLAILRVVEKIKPTLRPSVCAGLSLGEYTALIAAGAVSFKEGLSIVRRRAELMQAACLRHPGSMSVVLGLELESVQKGIEGIDGVWIANQNCPGQIVISGRLESIDLASIALKARGAKRVLPLEVSGAFHSGLMQEAQDFLRPHLVGAKIEMGSVKIVMNVTGASPHSLDEMRQNMVEQVTRPVLWQKGIETMDVEEFIEIGPGKTLMGMNKRIGVQAPTRSIGTVEDLKGL